MVEKKKSPSDKSTFAYDKRLIERNVLKGLVSKADVEAHMKNLPDLQSQADNIADKVWGPEQR